MVRAGMSFCVAAWALMAAGTAQAGNDALIPHRATYALSLIESGGTRGPAAARGMIAYDFSGSSCEGYTTNFRQMMEISPHEGPTHMTDMRSTTFEDGEFKSFRFKVKSTNDGMMGDDVDGTANRGPDGALAVRLSHPKSNRLDLSTGILFPTEHLMQMIAAARAGETTLSRQVYDGSDNGEKLFDTLTVIGKAASAASNEEGAKSPALAKVQRWPVTVSYFETGKDAVNPAYILSFDLYENGVSGNLKLDYGEFALKGELTSFEAKSVAECKK